MELHREDTVSTELTRFAAYQRWTRVTCIYIQRATCSSSQWYQTDFDPQWDRVSLVSVFLPRTKPHPTADVRSRTYELNVVHVQRSISTTFGNYQKNWLSCNLKAAKPSAMRKQGVPETACTFEVNCIKFWSKLYQIWHTYQWATPIWYWDNKSNK